MRTTDPSLLLRSPRSGASPLGRDPGSRVAARRCCDLIQQKSRPAFVDTYRTLLADPPPELLRLFERLPKVLKAA
jgi:hypothetical protein